MPTYDADERRFFGEFLLNDSARLGEVGAVYGFSVPEDVGELTGAQDLSNHFHGRQVKGDRIRLGEVELVIQEIQQGETVTVGLKLPQPPL